MIKKATKNSELRNRKATELHSLRKRMIKRRSLEMLDDDVVTPIFLNILQLKRQILTRQLAILTPMEGRGS